MGFHPTNDLHQCVKMVRLFFGFVDLVKNSGGCLFTDLMLWLRVKCEMVTLKAWVTSLITWGYKVVLGLFPRIRENNI